MGIQTDVDNPSQTSAVSSASQGGDQIVLLVVPPFQGLRCPALGVSQLKANLDAAGFPSEILYLNMLFAERIRPRVHEWISATGPSLLGEFVFSYAVHERSEDDVVRYVKEVLAGTDTERELVGWFRKKNSVEALAWLIGQAKDFIRTDAIQAVLRHNPWMVGCSSTFQSNCCSLAVTRKIKQQRPDIVTVMGGANCEMEMGEELMQMYPELDFVGRGECDKTLVELVRALKGGESAKGVAGFLTRGNGQATCQSTPLQGPDLDAQPYPAFQDYFDQLAEFKFRNMIRPGLAMETSRGCWWGEKHHCTFCAFNREGMIFRSKSPGRAIDEIESQVARYGLDRMEITDNILDMTYFKSLVPQLAEKPAAEFFWETKSNLTREQVQVMRRAGIVWIQPGLESLSDETLRLMRKGTTQHQNISLLKWCAEVGIHVSWNWLYGFPGEDEAELPELSRKAEAVFHLQPPNGASVLYLERFAPYQTTPEEWGLEPIRPSKAYGHVYPVAEESLHRLAFFFECDFLEGKDNSEGFKRLEKTIAKWKKAFPRSHLLAAPVGKSLFILDTRPCAKRILHRLTGLRRDVYEHCWKARVARDVERTFQSQASAEKISKILQSFIDDLLLLENAGRYLSLATDPHFGYRNFPTVFPGGEFFWEGKRHRNAKPRIMQKMSLRNLKAVLIHKVVYLVTRRGRLSQQRRVGSNGVERTSKTNGSNGTPIGVPTESQEAVDA